MFGTEVNPHAEKPQSKKPRSAAGNPTDMCRSWIHGYFETMSCTTPALAGSGDRAASGVMHYSKGRPGYEWNQYKDTFDKDDRIVRSGFNKAWKEQLDKGWTCRKTGAHYVLKERTVRARGFKKCSVCENLEEKMRKAKREGSSPATRLAIREEIEAHLKHIRACRTKYADQNMEAITDPSVASAAMDAAAQRGHRLPMLATEHSKLTGMKKLQLKITGVLMHRQGKKVYYAYVTPPWLKTGANMSCSILMALIESGALRGKKRLYLQINGASDNVAYTVLYFSAWLLLMAQAGRFGEDLVVESIVLSRLPVGHTHIGKCLLVDAGLTPFPLCPPTHPPTRRARVARHGCPTAFSQPAITKASSASLRLQILTKFSVCWQGTCSELRVAASAETTSSPWTRSWRQCARHTQTTCTRRASSRLASTSTRSSKAASIARRTRASRGGVCSSSARTPAAGGRCCCGPRCTWTTTETPGSHGGKARRTKGGFGRMLPMQPCRGPRNQKSPN